MESNIDIESNIVLATPWNVFKYNVVLHRWWRVKGCIVKFFWERRWQEWIGKKK